jgi:hypothetical protein
MGIQGLCKVGNIPVRCHAERSEGSPLASGDPLVAYTRPGWSAVRPVRLSAPRGVGGMTGKYLIVTLPIQQIPSRFYL